MKRAAWVFAALLLGLAGVLAATLWLATTAGGFRWLVGSATTLSGGQLIVEGVSGHLGTPIRIHKLVYTTDAQRVTLERVQLEWQPHRLWQRRLEIDLLATERVRVEILKKDPTPMQLPATLRLPLTLQVTAWDVAQLDLLDAGQTLRFKHLHGSLEDDGVRYQFTAAAATPWAEVDGELGIDKDAPFQLQGGFNVARATPGAIRARLGLGGQLAAIDFRLDAQAENMSLMASGEAAPFSRVRLPRLVVAGQGIDPRQFVVGAPQADLAFSGVFEGQPGARLLGSFALGNRQPGRLDQNRLPLTKLTGAVAGNGDEADFSALMIDLGAAGVLSGDGQWRDGRVNLTLSSPRLDLAGIHHALYPTRIRTTLQLTGDAARQTLNAELAESWGQGRFSLSLADAVLRLQDAVFSGQAGRLTASGSLALDRERAFSANFDASRINPQRFGNFPRAQLNARGQVSGALQPELSLQAQFTLPPGELDGRPVRGQGRLRYADQHLSEADIDLDLAGNRARLKGAYGRAGDRLSWDINAPALARLKLGLAGRLSSTGSASGEPQQPQIDGQLDAKGLRLPGEIAADSLNLQLRMQAAASGLFNGRLEARGLQWAGQRISLAQATVEGRRDAHTLALDLRLPDWRVLATLAGGLETTPAGPPQVLLWRGQLTQAEVQGQWPMQLNAPAELVLGRDQQQLSKLVLSVAGGQVSIAQFSHQGNRFATHGTLANLPLAPVVELLKRPLPFTTDLRVNGDWNLRFGDSLDGAARLVRQSGDVHLADPAMNLGLTVLRLALTADTSRVNARLEVDAREAGSVRAEGHATLERDGAGLILPRSAPLAWTATLEVPNLRPAKRFLPLGVRSDARLAAQLAGSGSLAAPRVDGRIDASQIRFAMPEEGVAITDGTLKLLLAGDRVRVEEGELKGQSGRIVVSGEAQLKNPQAGLTLKFEKFAAVNRSDRRAIVSGTTRLNLDPKRLELTGELTADRARLEIPEATRPDLSSDVVVVGRPPREKPAAQRFPLALDLKLALGDDFLFQGAGLDARLGGRLRVFTVNQTVRGEGTIQVEKGRYAAYAQTLDIERGVLRFVGPMDDPGLDVLAVRKMPSVTAGVQVGGTVRRPVVKLYSDPAMPDTEKLAWLVLGHGLESGGQQEFALLQVAAGALLSQAESANFQAKLASSLGIDSFDVRAGSGEDLSSAVVSVGKRVSSRATLSYEQTLDGLGQVVKMVYQLTPHVRLETQAGQENSFDAFYSLDYD